MRNLRTATVLLTLTAILTLTSDHPVAKHLTLEQRPLLQYDLDLLHARLRHSFPDALIQVSQLREHVIIEGQARSQREAQQIENTVRSFLDSTGSALQAGGDSGLIEEDVALPQPGFDDVGAAVLNDLGLGSWFHPSVTIQRAGSTSSRVAFFTSRSSESEKRTCWPCLAASFSLPLDKHAAVLGAGPGTAVVAIAVVYAPLYFRVVRGSVLSEAAQTYVEAAEALGLGRLGILVRHILPNVRRSR